MALRLPTLEDLRTRWSEIRHLYQHPEQLRAIRDMLRAAAPALGIQKPTPEDPISFALDVDPRRYKWLDAPHLQYLSHEVSEAYWNCDPLLVAMPPQHAKSTTCSVWLPFWALAQDPTMPILFISYEARFARKWGIRVRNLVNLYGERYGLRINPKQAAGDEWETTAGGGMQTAGAGGPIPGKTAKLLIIDDPIKQDDAASPIMRESIWEWWETTVLARAAADTTIIVIGTLWHEDDLLSRIMKQSADPTYTGLKFKAVRLPAIAEEEDPIDREEGEGLWTQHPRFPQSWYEQTRDSRSPHIWTTVYQCRATPREGTLVDPAWWQFYRRSELPARFSQEIQSWDLALESKKAHHSFNEGVVLSRDENMIYVRDEFHEHCGITDVAKAARRWSSIYPRAVSKVIERKASGPAFIQTWSRKIPGLIPWPPDGARRMGSKESRLNAIIPYIRGGNILLPINDDGTQPKWVQDFIEEFRQFPNGTHDDRVDALSQGTLFMLPGAWEAEDRGTTRHLQSLEGVPTPEEAHTAYLHDLIGRGQERETRRLRRELGQGSLPDPAEVVERAASGSPSVLPFSLASAGLRRAIGGARRGSW